ncbi:MAG: hypothetical protein JWM72_2473, partial [Actinomycetia bacterium]|nr:hypothetical protein [Actinomycetes bacterium]
MDDDSIQMMARYIAKVAVPPTPMPSHFSDEPGLIGRTDELDTLAALVEHARAG